MKTEHFFTRHCMPDELNKLPDWAMW